MAELETEHEAQLKEQLKLKRRLLHERELQLARAGIYADPAITIATEDLRAEVATLERQLRIAQPAPVPVQRVRYEPPPRPERDFAAEQEAQRERARQRDVEHYQGLLRTHRFNLSHYREQARRYGGIDIAPPITRHGMQEGRAGIVEAKRALRQLGIVVDDLPGDE